MRRRSLLSLLAAPLVAAAAGCSDGDDLQGFDKGGDADGGYEGDPAAVVDVLERGIPRQVGPSLTGDHAGTLAVTVVSADEARRVFDPDVDDAETAAQNRQFLEETNFDREVLLSIEQRVPDASYDLELDEISFDGTTATVSFSDRREDEAAASMVTTSGLLLRFDAAETGITGVEVASDGETVGTTRSEELD